MKCHIENEKKMSMFFKAVFPPIFWDFKKNTQKLYEWFSL